MTLFDTLTQQSGSLGQTVFSRNQHGPYTRDRTVPVDPSSAQQVVVRAALSECVTAWKNTLTESQRTSWDSYALAVRTRTALGRSTNAGGLGMFVRANVPRIQAGVGPTPRVDQAPRILTSPDMESLTRVVLNIVDQTLIAYVTFAQQWLNQPGGALLFYASRPQPLTVNFHRSPYRLAGKLNGEPLGPSYSPFTFPIPFPATVDQRVFVRARQTRADARLGPSIYLQADHVPQVAPTPILATWLPPFARQLFLTFTDIIRPEPRDLANWTVKLDGRIWSVDAIADQFDPTNTITLQLTRTGVPAAPQGLSFSPPPDDVHGINTGLPVAAFTDFPVVPP